MRKKMSPGAALAAMRVNPGRKKLLRECLLCGRLKGAREMRSHLPQCRKRQRRREAK